MSFFGISDNLLVQSGVCDGCSSTKSATGPDLQMLKLTHPELAEFLIRNPTSHVKNDIQIDPLKECHKHIHCNGCESYPVLGKRFKCIICKDCDLCESCLNDGMRSDDCQPDHEYMRRFSNGNANNLIWIPKLKKEINL